MHKNTMLGFALGIVTMFLVGFTALYTPLINWGFDSVLRTKEWVSPDGRMSTQSQMPNMSTAYDCWPTASPTKPTSDSLCELTLNRYQWDHASMERISVSAMVDQTDGGAYRIGVEKGGTGQYRPIIFCFENTSPGLATCPLKIQPNGVYVLQSNGTYLKLGS